MAGLSPESKVGILSAMFNAISYSVPSGLYIGLHSGDPGNYGVSNEISYTGYVRQPITFTAADVNGVKNSATITFPETDSSVGDVTYFSIHTEATGSHFICSGTLTGGVLGAIETPVISAEALEIGF